MFMVSQGVACIDPNPLASNMGTIDKELSTIDEL